MSMNVKPAKPTFLQIKADSQKKYKEAEDKKLQELNKPLVALFGSTSTATTRSNSPSSSSPEHVRSSIKLDRQDSIKALLDRLDVEIEIEESESDSEPQYSIKAPNNLVVDSHIEDYDEADISTPINSPGHTTPTPPNSPDYTIIGSNNIKRNYI